MNFVFDVGNVLLTFLPVPYLQRLFSDAALVNQLNKLVFQSPEWAMLDEGVISRDAATDVIVSRAPQLEGQIRNTMNNLCTMFDPIQGTIDLLPRVKAAGHGLYFLSNYHDDLKTFVWDKFPFFQQFQGGIFSCDVKMVKPGEAIYKKLLDTYALNPQDTVFFDDMQPNVDGANRVGIKGLLFTCPEDVAVWI